MLVVSLIAMGSGLSAVAAGYLFGARRGVSARRELTQHCRGLERELDELRALAASAPEAHKEAEALRSELTSLGLRLEAQEQHRSQALHEELRSLTQLVREREVDEQKLRQLLETRFSALQENSAKPEDLSKELRKLMAPVLERESETRGLREMVHKVMSPVLERERIGRDLARVELSAGQLELPKVLEAIAQSGGFSAVVLSDSAGLPLAASLGTQNVDELAGSSALVFTLAERAQREGQAPVVALILHHADNQLVLHRIFDLRDCRLMLTAVTRGRALAPDALDPALGSVERALAQRGGSRAA